MKGSRILGRRSCLSDRAKQRHALTRRQFLQTSATMVGSEALAQLLAGCGAPSPLKGPAKIIFGSYSDPALDVLRDTILPEFEQETGVQTEWVEADFSGWYQKAINDGQTKAGAFDIYVMDDMWVPRFAGGGYLANLGELGLSLDNDFVGTAVELGFWPPRSGLRQPGTPKNTIPSLYAFPFVGDVQLLFYRNDIYTSGPPETWDDVLRMAREKSDPLRRQYGWVTRGLKGNPIMNSYFVLLHSFGGRMFDDDWSVDFNSPQGVEALEFYLSLARYSPPGAAEFDSDQEGQTLLQGNAFAATMWTGWCAQTDDPRKSRVLGRISFDVPPRRVHRVAKLGLFMAGVASSAPHKSAALEFFKWFFSPANQVKFARAGGTSLRSSALEDHEARRRSRWLPAAQKAFLLGVASPRTPDWYKVEEILGTSLNRALIAKGNAKQHLDVAAAETTDFLRKAGYLIA